MTTVQISSTFSLSLTSRFPPDISRDRKVLHRVHLSKVGKGKGKVVLRPIFSYIFSRAGETKTP